MLTPIRTKERYWIVGMPSGEALNISEEELDELYTEDLVGYNSSYGFYFFEDKNKTKVDELISKIRGGYENIQEHIFDDSLVKNILNFLDTLTYKVNFIIKGNMMQFSFYNYDIVVEKVINYTDVYTVKKLYNKKLTTFQHVLGHRKLYEKILEELELL